MKIIKYYQCKELIFSKVATLYVTPQPAYKPAPSPTYKPAAPVSYPKLAPLKPITPYVHKSTTAPYIQNPVPVYKDLLQKSVKLSVKMQSCQSKQKGPDIGQKKTLYGNCEKTAEELDKLIENAKNWNLALDLSMES